FVLILSLISTYVIGKYSYEKAKSALVQRTFDQLTSLRIEKTNRIQNFFAQCASDISNLSRLDDTKEIVRLISQLDDPVNNRVSNAYNNFIKDYIEAGNNYSKIIFISKSGALMINMNDKAVKNDLYILPLDKVQLNILKELNSSNDWILKDMNELDGTGELKIWIASRVNDNAEGEKGAVILEIPIEVINDIMFENRLYNGLGKTGETYLVGSDYLLRSTSRFENNSVLKTKVATEGVKEAFNGITGTKEIQDYRNVSVLSSFSTLDVPGLNWAILAEIDTKEAMVPIVSIKSNIMYLTFIIFLLLLGVVALLTAMITAPIRSLIGKTDKVAAGEFGQTLNYKANDEVGDLVHAFNKMTMQLKAQSEKLEEERKLRLNSLIDGQELERRRLSKELHDGLGQLILTNKLKVERALKEEPGEAKQIISESEELFRITMQEIRNISNGLMPAVLTAFGLETAIRNLTKEIADSSEININVNIEIDKPIINSKYETYLYRIVQEALNNVIKHAMATQVNLDLCVENGELKLSIQDNGTGVSFDDMNKPNGNGLNNMQYRAELLGGDLKITGTSGKGTKVVLQIKNFHYGSN
ncbi:MAG: hypothetical protein C0591_08405, partial [Marinilabiliales bacterium]